MTDDNLISTTGFFLQNRGKFLGWVMLLVLPSSPGWPAWCKLPFFINHANIGIVLFGLKFTKYIVDTSFLFFYSFELRTQGSCRCPPSRSCRQPPRQSLWWDRGQRCTAVSGVWQFQIYMIRIFILRRDLSSLLSTSSEQPRVIRLLPWPQSQLVFFDPKDEHCRNCECCPSYMSWHVKLCLSCLCDLFPLWEW